MRRYSRAMEAVRLCYLITSICVVTSASASTVRGAFIHSASYKRGAPPRTDNRLLAAVPPLEDDTNVSINYDTTTIANHTFRLPTSDHLETIQERQVFHPLQSSQVFCISTHLCKWGHPQAFGFHPTNGPKPQAGLFRLSCPLLCQAIDEYEGEGGVRQMSDWLRSKDIRDIDEDWKRKGYEKANEAQKNIRVELAKDDKYKLISRMGDYNAQRFLESGVAGIPSDQTFNVKCIHAHVADHLCRCNSSNDGNIIGKEALKILEERGVPVLGNDVCWQQCNNHERQPSDWKYIPKKNRQKLRSTRQRRKERPSINVETDELDSKAKQYGYKSPSHSASFLKHLESVRSSWPYDPNDDESAIEGREKSVPCTGEPAIDPSRMLQDADWI